MNRPIHFNDEFRGGAIEVYDETADGVLAAKPHPQRLAPQPLPQSVFGLGRIVPHRKSGGF